MIIRFKTCGCVRAVSGSPGVIRDEEGLCIPCAAKIIAATIAEINVVECERVALEEKNRRDVEDLTQKAQALAMDQVLTTAQRAWLAWKDPQEQ